MTARTVLIAAQSGRALAASARRAGYAPLVADLFGDLDTQLAAQSWRVAGDWRRGFRRRNLLAALTALANGESPIGLVCGSGFEDRPALLDRAAAAGHALLGNDAQTVARTKDPLAFAALCRAHDVPHPATAMTALPGWLTKRRGGSGGAHIRVAQQRRTLRPGRYAQQPFAGRPVSALFLGDGQAGVMLGFSAQWSDPRPRRPFRYGGAVRPARLPPARAAAMTEAIARLIPPLGLRGLNSADFLIGDKEEFVLVEINPRPGATLDIFPDADGDLFRQHVQACRGQLPAAPPEPVDAAAAAVVYAPHDLAVPRHFEWPDWAADRQSPGSAIPAHAPLCTVRAQAPDPDAARALLDRRAETILSRMSRA